jgi:hypothetical protein
MVPGAFAELRKYPRTPVTSQPEGMRIVRQGFNKPIRYLAVDVSQNGLGILSDDGLLVSEPVLFLEFTGALIPLKPCWCTESEESSSLGYRYGLECAETSVNLTEIFLSLIPAV